MKKRKYFWNDTVLFNLLLENIETGTFLRSKIEIAFLIARRYLMA